MARSKTPSSAFGAVCLLFILNALSFQVADGSARSFTIDYDKNTFLKDGEPFYYVSGSIHYARIPYQYWKDRLTKMYAAGLDAVQFYIPWNVHEPTPGEYKFDGQEDLEGIIVMAQEIGLLVILRAGPYICGEWEYGGFPPWILKENGSIVVRTMDPGYIKPVDRWLSVLLPKIAKHTYANGGPVIMVQAENEYGSYFACDNDYMEYLKNTFRKYLGNDIILFTTDGAGDNFLVCGSHKGLFITVDFGPGNATENFKPLIKKQPKGPRVNSEFYTGWLDYWGGQHAHGDTTAITNTLKQMIEMKASSNMYMFEGGTSFGYMNGADPTFQICPTSYDYDAPLTENGDTTDKYMQIRALIGKYKKLPDIPVPPNIPKFGYGKIELRFISSVLDALETIGPAVPVKSDFPLSMEQVGQNYGYILYRHIMKKTYATALFNCTGIRDRGYVMVDGRVMGVLDRNVGTTFDLFVQKDAQLDILVENQGRINFGKDILGQRKGILGNVTVGNDVLEDWEIFPLNYTKMFKYADEVAKLKFRSKSGNIAESRTPSFYMGSFVAPDKEDFPQDTFLNMDGWFKGQAFVNGFNLGRYWPVKGPQVTLYVPGVVLKPFPSENILLIAEMTQAPCQPEATRWQDRAGTCTISLTDQPILNSTSISKQAYRKPYAWNDNPRLNVL